MGIPSVGPYVGAVPEDRHAERVVGDMLTCLDDFAATIEPQLGAAMGARIPGSVKGQERFVARLAAVPSPAIIDVAVAYGKRCKFTILLSLWEKDEFGGANVVSCTASANGPGTEKRASYVCWRRWIPTRSATPSTALVPQRKVGFPIPNPRLLLGFQRTKTARREGISNPFSDARGCTSPQNSGDLQTRIDPFGAKVRSARRDQAA